MWSSSNLHFTYNGLQCNFRTAICLQFLFPSCLCRDITWHISKFDLCKAAYREADELGYLHELKASKHVNQDNGLWCEKILGLVASSEVELYVSFFTHVVCFHSHAIGSKANSLWLHWSDVHLLVLRVIHQVFLCLMNEASSVKPCQNMSHHPKVHTCTYEPIVPFTTTHETRCINIAAVRFINSINLQRCLEDCLLVTIKTLGLCRLCDVWSLCFTLSTDMHDLLKLHPCWKFTLVEKTSLTLLCHNLNQDWYVDGGKPNLPLVSTFNFWPLCLLW